MWWLIPLVCACFLSLINPYVGMMGFTFSLAFLIICFAFDVNVNVRKKVSSNKSLIENEKLNRLVRNNARRLSIVWRVATVLVCIATAFASSVTWLIAAQYKQIVTPLVINALESLPASGMLLVGEIAALAITAVLIFARCKKTVSLV